MKAFIFEIIYFCLTLIGYNGVCGWDFDYIDINPEVDVTDVTFRLYSTRHAENEWGPYRDILFDEESGEASLEDVGFFNGSIQSKIIAHGNGGGYSLARNYWLNYTEVADKVGKNYNVIAMHWGSGFPKTSWAGIKTAKVVKSFVEKYGLKIEDIHGIGFSYGAHVINAMATELNDIGLGKIDRLTLLDPGCKVPKYKIDGKTQYGLIHKDDASFVDVFHTSQTGIWQMPVGDVDVWVNGGKGQPTDMAVGPHRAATYYFSRTIIMTLYDECHYNAWQCVDPDWSSFAWTDRNEMDTCEFGDPKTENAIQVVGEYINREEPFLATGNFIFFTNPEFGSCDDLICEEAC